MKFTRVLFFIILPLYMVSCKPQQKLPYYLDNVTDSTVNRTIKVPELIIQKNDKLSIKIYSLSTKPDVSDAIYNQPAAAGEDATGTSTSGYMVDNEGNIYHHRLGVFHVEGLTKKEVAAEIKKRLTEPVVLLEDPTVVISLLNFKVTVLGQVGKVGEIDLPGENLTILQAIGLAGGVTDYGKKDSLRILREYNGKREIGVVSLSSPELFTSPFYNLVQNDILMVGETGEKERDAQQAKTAQKISFALTVVTVAATLANIFIRN